MANESNNRSDPREPVRRIDAGFEPNPALDGQDCYLIINELSNLLMEGIETLNASGNPGSARLIAENACQVLILYDPAIAKLVSDAADIVSIVRDDENR